MAPRLAFQRVYKSFQTHRFLELFLQKISLTPTSFISHWLVSTAFSLRDLLNNLNNLSSASLRRWISDSFLFLRVPGTVLSVASIGAASGRASSSRGAVPPAPRVRLPLSPQASPTVAAPAACSRSGVTRALGQWHSASRSPSCARVLIGGRPSIDEKTRTSHTTNREVLKTASPWLPKSLRPAQRSACLPLHRQIWQQLIFRSDRLTGDPLDFSSVQAPGVTLYAF